MNLIPFSKLSNDKVIELAKSYLSTDLPEWEKEIWRFIERWYEGKLESISVSTSGSTGNPKTIQHRKQAIVHSAEMTLSFLHIKKNTTALLCLPADKISGIMMIVRAIIHKMDLYYIRPSRQPLKETGNQEIDFAAFTPTQITSITSDKKDREKFEKISTIILGGEGVSDDLMKSIEPLNNNVYSTFGMTETISHIAFKRLSRPLEKTYRVLDGITITTDSQFRLIIDAPQLNVYQLQTNDEVNLLSEKEFIWKGRTDNVINSGGLKIHPEEIENSLKEIITLPFFIGKTPDNTIGEKPVLILEKDQWSKEAEALLLSALRKIETKPKIREIYLVDEFCKTDNGKLKRNETIKKATFYTSLKL